MCRHVCPVGHVTSRETLTPHAWALTIESVRRRQLAWNEETAAVMYACADCGLCQTHCVTDQPLPDAIVNARAEIVRIGAAPASVLEFQKHLETSVRARIDFPSAGRVVFAAREARSRGVLELPAALQLLDAAGLSAEPAGEGASTGLVASELGLVDLATRFARDLVAAVTASGVREVLVLGPADKWTFEHVYPKRLRVEWPANVRVTEVTATLAAAYANGTLRLSRRLGPPPAYHDPCHGARSGRDARAPRRLLTAIYGDQAGPELFWRANRAHPCGAVGGLDVTHPDLARQLASARLSDAASSGAATLVTDDPTCLAHLGASADPRVAVVGLYGQLAQCL
jgi:Fe-S oxidoreductase